MFSHKFLTYAQIRYKHIGNGRLFHLLGLNDICNFLFDKKSPTFPDWTTLLDPA